MGQFIDFAYVKTHADFPAVLNYYQVETKCRGTEVRCLCPFHDDETPSMSVNTDKKVFTCHAASCGEKGNILEFVAAMEDVDLRQAAIQLASICDIELADTSRKPTKGPRRKKSKPKVKAKAKRRRQSTPEPDGNDIEKAVTKAFEGEAPFDDNMAKSPKPLGFTLNLDPSHGYGSERSLSPSAIERFGMGFCSRGIMKDRWCVPLHNADGELVAYCGRWALRKRPKDMPKYLLPPDFDKTQVLFNLHRVIAERSAAVVIVEGVFDAIRLHDMGAPVVALLGSSISEAQVGFIREHFISAHVILDGGEDKARMKVVDRLAQELLVQSVILPDGEDPESVSADLIEEKIPGPVLG